MSLAHQELSRAARRRSQFKITLPACLLTSTGKVIFWFVGFWFLVFGFWFLVFGFWFLVFGFWFLVFGF
ncbi:hypothetical protein [Paenibacillus sp. CF095]|uniref:hypothetical protein n=1 Tax=Paenibacillus sp. CF095 TaxID=1881033 RepID=UPI0015A1E243|nr:hypothetical protein [Paenibacillus sp. CF095]